MTQILEVDVGNTRIKWRILTPVKKGSRLVPLASGVTIETLLEQCLINVNECRISVVGQYDEASLRTKLPSTMDFIKGKTLGNYHALKNSYTEVNRMGVDRWLAMMAIWSKQPGPSILVDSGTALKIEIIQKDGQHLGGYILPGFDMQRRALLKGTAHIHYYPCETLDAYETQSGASALQPALKPGCSTETCIDQGIRLSQVASIEKILALYPDYALWITGGDGQALAQLLNTPCVYKADLVLDGLSVYADYIKTQQPP